MFRNKLPQLFRYTFPRLNYKIVQNALQINKNTRIFNYKSLISSTLLASFFITQTQFGKTSLSEEYREVEVAKVNDIGEGEMKEIKVGPNKEDTILVVKYQGTFYAVGSKCTHFGAPLEKGVLFDDKVYCPLHCAAFSIQTGTPEMGPVWDGLSTYQVKEKNGSVYVMVPKVVSKPQTPELTQRLKHDLRKFVIVGGGPSALSAAQTLRQSGYTGEIIMITNENDLPYDKTILSKNPLGIELKFIQIRDESFFEKYGITVMKGTNVKRVDVETDEIEIEGKNKIKYDRLLIATGAKPIVPPVKGVDLKNVFTLRNFNDTKKIREAVKNSKKVVIIGGSFIGLETASAIKKELKGNIDIVVVEAGPAPFARILGKEVGEALKKLHEDNGVKFVVGKRLTSIAGNEEVKSVQLDDGTSLDADMVILGTGIKPNSDLVAKSLKLGNDGSINTDIFLRTSKNNVFASGDVANFPYWYSGTRARIEHYNEAIKQGSIAAFNMLGKNIPHDQIPFFWTRQWDKSLHFTGYVPQYDNVHIEGDLDKLSFVAYYSKNDYILGVAAMNKGPIAIIMNQAMQLNVLPKASELKSGKITLDDIKKRIAEKKGACKCKVDACCKK